MTIKEINELRVAAEIATQRTERKIEERRMPVEGQRIVACILIVPIIWVLRLVYDTAKMTGGF